MIVYIIATICYYMQWIIKLKGKLMKNYVIIVPPPSTIPPLFYNHTYKFNEEHITS
jgi:hypothetical protein